MPELLDTGYCGRVERINFSARFLLHGDEDFTIDLSQFRQFKNLLHLSLSGTTQVITDVTPFAELKNLDALDLSDTQVADISPLAGLKRLRWLYLTGTQVTDEQVNELQQALPNCRIIR